MVTVLLLPTQQSVDHTTVNISGGCAEVLVNDCVPTIRHRLKYLHSSVHITGLHCVDMAGLEDLRELQTVQQSDHSALINHCNST